MTIRNHVHGILGGLLLSLGFFRLASPIGALLLSLVMRMGLFVILAAFTAEEKENLLSVARTHISSLIGVGYVVKSEDIFGA
jgi:hypothetical protein